MINHFSFRYFPWQILRSRRRDQGFIAARGPAFGWKRVQHDDHPTSRTTIWERLFQIAWSVCRFTAPQIINISRPVC